MAIDFGSILASEHRRLVALSALLVPCELTATQLHKPRNHFSCCETLEDGPSDKGDASSNTTSDPARTPAIRVTHAPAPGSAAPRPAVPAPAVPAPTVPATAAPAAAAGGSATPVFSAAPAPAASSRTDRFYSFRASADDGTAAKRAPRFRAAWL